MTNKREFNKFLKKFEVQKFKIKEYNHWVWILRKNQSTIGSSIIFPKKEYYNKRDLSEEEFKELKYVIEEIENNLTTLFNYTEINYLTLMMNDPIVHTHIIPRYEKGACYKSKNYPDRNYPKIPNLECDMVQIETKEEIIKDLKDLL